MARRILISNAWLREIGGSELVAIELAEEYARRGWEVMLCSPYISSSVRSSISAMVNIADGRPDLDAGWDIVWDHHGVLMPYLEKRPGQLIVTNHMSSYVDTEKPKYNPSIVDRIFCNSEETRKSMNFEYSHRAELMQNPAPRWNVNIARGHSALFISKHRPPELEALIGKMNMTSLVYNGDVRIERRNFMWANFVVCNGKSVQYALVTGVPVFLYDHFGGPGWLTPENFEKAAYYNFSGRGFTAHPQVLDTLFLHDTIEAIPQEMVNWRFKLHEWLYYRELV